MPAGYNVIDAAFPVILSDGTAEWFSGMDTNVKVPSPQEICDAKAAGHWVLLSIGGAAAAVDLSSTTPVDKFISTIVPILKSNNFDGIDIDIESGKTHKIAPFEAVLYGFNSFDGDFGPRYQYRFRGDDGNVYIWWASEGPAEALGLGGLDAAKRVRVRIVGGTIKKHTAYQGVNQTVVKGDFAR